MKSLRNFSNLFAVVSVLAVSPAAFAATDTWTATANGTWSTGANWSAGAPVATNTLVFGSTTGGPITATNDTTANTAYAGLTFGTGATSFVLTGNAINLSGAVTDSSTNAQTISLNQALVANENYSVISGGSLSDTGVISGTGFGVTATGGGTLSLGAANTYTGGTTVNGLSTLNLNFAAAGAPTSNIINSGNAVTLGGTGGGGTLTMTGASATANTQALGSFTLGAGANIITLTPGASGGTTGLTISTFNAISDSTRGTVQFSSTGTTTLTNMVSQARFTDSQGNIYATYGTDDWAATNGSGVVGAATYTAAATTPASSSSTLYNVTGSWNTGASVTVGALRFADPTGRTVTVNSTNTFTDGGILVASTAGASSIGGSTGNIRPIRSSGASTYSFNVIQNSANNFTIAAKIQNSSSSTGALVKSGTGTLVLSGANGYSGGTFIDQGTIVIGAVGGGTTGNLGSGGVTNYGSLIYSLTNALTESNTIGGSGTLSQVGSGTTTLSVANTYTGNTTISAGALNLGNALSVQNSTVTNSVTNGLQFTSGIGAFTIGGLAGASNEALVDTASAGVALTLGNNNNNANYSGILSGAGSVVKAGTGTQTLSGANTYSGGTTISAGTLQVNNATALGGNAGAVSVTSGAVLDLNGTTMTGTNALTLNGTGISSGGALINSSTTGGTYAGLVTLGSASSIVAGSGNITLSNTGTITGAGFGLTLDGAKNGSVASVIGTGSGTLTKNGTGTWTLSGANTYTGTTTVNAGQLTLSGSGTLGSGAALTLAGGAVDLGGTSTSVGAVSITTAAASGNTLQNGSLTGTSYAASNTTGNAIVTANLLANGSAGVTKTGTGTLTLSGADTYTGTTAVNAGTLAAGSSSALGNGAALTLGGGTLDLGGFTDTVGAVSITTAAASGNTIQNGSLTGTSYAASNTTGNALVTANLLANGSAGLTKSGSGSLTLSGANTYTGGNAINGGTVFQTSSGGLGNGGALTMGGGSLDLGGFADTVGAVSITAAAASGNTITNGGSLTGTSYAASNTTGNAIVTVALLANGSAGLAKSGSGTLTLTGANTYTGNTTISGGVIQVGTNGTLGASASTVVFQGGTLTSTYNSSTSYSLGQAISVASGQTGTINLSERVSMGGNVSGAGTLNLNANTTVSRDDFNNSWTGFTGQLNIAGSGVIRLLVNGGSFDSGSFGNASVDLGGSVFLSPITNSGGNTYSFGALSGSSTTAGLGGGTTGRATWSIGALNTSTTFAGIIQTNGAVTKTGTGTLTLTGASTYTGATTINGGAIAISAANNIGDNTAATNTIAFGGGTLESTGNTYNLGTNRAVALNTGGGTIQVDAGTLTLDGVVTGTTTTSSLKKTGAGTLALTGSNTYTGGTTLNAGTLQISGSGNIGGTRAFAFNGGTLQYTAASAGSTDITAAPVGSVQNVTISAGGGTIDTNGNTVTYANGIGNSGTGGLTLADSNGTPGSLILDGVNTYTGATTIASGTLLLEDITSSPGNNDLSASSGVNLTSSTASLDIGQGNSQVIKDLSGVAGSTVFLGNDNLTAGTSNSTTFAGSIKNGGNFSSGTNASFTKQGSGTMTLSGANTYTGATKVLGGTLSVTGSLAGGTAAITTVGGTGSSSSPTLNGTGTINGKVIVASAGTGVAGTITPGTAATPYGTLTIGGTISFQTGSNFAINMSGASSGELIIGGAATIGSGADITINLGSALTQSSYTLATAASGLNSGSFTVLGALPAGYSLVYTSTALLLQLPSTSNGQFTLTTTSAAPAIHVGGTTTLSTTIQNTGTGTQDTLNYSGLAATGTGVGGVTSGTTSGSALAQGATSTPAASQTLTGSSTGTVTIGNTATVTNSTASGTPVATNTGTSVVVYSGQGVWTGTASTGAWGGVSAAPANWTALGGTPGLDANFTGVDTATFGTVSGGTSATTVTLDTRAPNLNAINFTTPDRNYTIAQGSGSNSITLSGTTPSINVTNPGASATAGTQTISAPVIFGATTSVNVAANQTLALSGAISGSAGLNNVGSGATILSGANTYTGTTAISSGTVYVNNTSGSGTGTGAVTVSSGATLAGSGTIKPTGGAGVTISNGATLASGSKQTAYATANGGNGAVNGTGTGGGLTLDNTEAYSSLLNIAGGGKLTFALGSTTAFNGGTGALNFANPNTDSTYLSLTGSTVDQIFATSTTALTINLVDLTSGNTPGGVALTLRSQNPYLLIQTALGTNADFANLVTTGGTGVNGYVLGVNNGLGGYTAFNIGAYDINGNLVNSTSNLQNLRLYLYNGDLEVVPEPGTWALMLGGLALLVLIQRRKSKKV